ncbi:hypothetical protein CEUSTIGMA_g3835.t1 [Chlamydomonas eustigma]|uniref:FAD/NAD(P)-binding domain-containing protein n=1 Tax=Chlamydomonas eustigma TaxID=1157962 RepID=A0A250X0W4_9CHLO|nr:hypothetical protein CEUSTIGMA_g3835.t1 [Chlamydomonas eustigma]|eukprot:GAX76390.1 hypothetical protein CEUSTIGMA_g3835.t1 [Chlamydomonas eustigma]
MLFILERLSKACANEISTPCFRHRCYAVATALRVAIVGTGPAGFYTASQLLKRLGSSVHIDLIDRLPTPFGLVRSGVAPDHQDTKNVTHQYTSIARDERCSFFGNVTLGRDVSLRELRDMYNAVVLAYGAESDRKLGIPGEEAGNVFSAREFVWWYNGHPDAAHLPVDLKNVQSVAVCGIGNVALDCARVLLKGAERLKKTDLASHALQSLQQAAGTIEEVHLVARRGPVQAACAPKELKELVSDPLLTVHAPHPQMAISPSDEVVLKTTRTKKRIFEIISKAAAITATGIAGTQTLINAVPSSSAPVVTTLLADKAGPETIISRSSVSIEKHEDQGSSSGSSEQAVKKGSGTATASLHFQFYRNPVEIVVDPLTGKAAGLKVERTELRHDERQQGREGEMAVVAVGTGVMDIIPAQLILVSIGYKSLSIGGLPFDPRSGTVPHAAGRVIQTADSSSSGGTAAIRSDGGDGKGLDKSQQAVISSKTPNPSNSRNGLLEEDHGSEYERGLYVCGWLKRGATGIIGTNLIDAEETVKSIVQDWKAGLLPELLITSVKDSVPASSSDVPCNVSSPLVPLEALLESRGVKVVDFEGWSRIDAVEVERGVAEMRVRSKLVDLDTMIGIAVDNNSGYNTVYQ